MVHYRLLYFDGRGRAEVARQLFALANQDYVDVRIAHDEWPKHKPDMPFGQLPVLDVDGKLLAQSHAINRYLARQFGYAGKTAFEEALVDAFADQYRDFYTEAQPYLYAVWGFAKGDVNALEKDVFVPARDKFFNLMTKFLKTSKSGFLVGDSVTWADLQLAELATFTEKYATLYVGFPEVKAHSEKVRSIPAIKKWIETRKSTPF